MPSSRPREEAASAEIAAAAGRCDCVDWLPPLPGKSGSFFLPLSGETAARLVSALVEHGRNAKRDSLAAALRGDPCFVLWTLCTASCSAKLATIELAAGWLDDGGWRSLQWPADDDAREPADAKTVPEEKEKLSAARFIADRASQVARERGLSADVAHAAEVLALVRAALGQIRGEPDLPAWLAADLGAIRARGARKAQTAAGSVAEALASAADREAPQLPPVANSNDGALLRRLVAKLIRLDDLETNFARRLEHAKLESLKELAYGAGHEINNPLANISARAQTLLKEETDPERKRKLAAINAQAFRAHEMIADMMLFARPPQIVPRRIDAAEFLTALRSELGERAAEQATELVIQPSHVPLELWADPVQLAVAVRALVVNALEALNQGGRVEIAIRAAGEPGAVEIEVRDNGPGILPEVREHLFDPYFSGREANRGLGFGLSKCWRIMTDHGGRIEVHSTPGQGATFVLSFSAAPVVDQKPD